MELQEPKLAYTASGNQEANGIVGLLESHGIAAFAVEDTSAGGFFAFGIIGQIHKPQVFVEAADAQRAAEFLRDYEQKRKLQSQELADAQPVESECEDCGTVSAFPAVQDGTVQNCPKCQALMDVGTFEWPESE